MIFGYVVKLNILNNFFLYMLPPLDLRCRDICQKVSVSLYCILPYLHTLYVAASGSRALGSSFDSLFSIVAHTSRRERRITLVFCTESVVSVPTVFEMKLYEFLNICNDYNNLLEFLI